MTKIVKAFFPGTLFSLFFAVTSVAQTVTAEYLDPNYGDGNPYRFLRFGAAAEYWGGLMWNNTDPTYGDGNDFTIYTYQDRDMFFLTRSGNIILNSTGTGNIGIGLKNPTEKLHVNGSIRGNQNGAIRIQTPTGYTDIGSKNSSWSHFNTDRPKFYFEKEITVNSGKIGSYDENLQLLTAGNVGITMLKSNGDVGIGTINPTEKLTINGTAKAEEVIVAENIGADFVFEADYPLPELSELEKYIDRHKHLPEIPTARQMKRDGVKVGDLQMKLLQKIEELTLYVIEQQKQIKTLKQELWQLKKNNK